MRALVRYRHPFGAFAAIAALALGGAGIGAHTPAGAAAPGGAVTSTRATAATPTSSGASWSVPFTLYSSLPTQLALPLNRQGEVKLVARWQGPELIMRLTSPGGTATEARGTGTAALSRKVSATEAAARGLWVVTFHPTGIAPDPKRVPAQRTGGGVLTVQSPVPDPAAADLAYGEMRRGVATGAVAQRLAAPASPPPPSPPMPAAATAPPPDLLANLTKLYSKVDPRGKPMPRVAGAKPAAPRIDRITLCQAEYYGGPLRDVGTIAQPLGWVMLHGANFAGASTQVMCYPRIADPSDVRLAAPYAGPPCSDSLLVVCVMAGSNCHTGSPGEGAFSVRVNGQESNRMPFRFPGMQPFHHVLVPSRAGDHRLGGDGTVTSTGGKWDQDTGLQPWGFQWPSDTSPGDAYRSEEMREFWESFIVWHNDVPTEHSQTVLGQTVRWKTSSSDHGTDEFFVGASLPPQFTLVDARVTPVIDQFSDLFGYANVSEVHPNSTNPQVRVNWRRAPGVSLTYRLQLLVRGPQYCAPEDRLRRP